MCFTLISTLVQAEKVYFSGKNAAVHLNVPKIDSSYEAFKYCLCGTNLMN